MINSNIFPHGSALINIKMAIVINPNVYLFKKLVKLKVKFAITEKFSYFFK